MILLLKFIFTAKIAMAGPIADIVTDCTEIVVANNVTAVVWSRQNSIEYFYSNRQQVLKEANQYKLRVHEIQEPLSIPGGSQKQEGAVKIENVLTRMGRNRQLAVDGRCRRIEDAPDTIELSKFATSCTKIYIGRNGALTTQTKNFGGNFFFGRDVRLLEIEAKRLKLPITYIDGDIQLPAYARSAHQVTEGINVENIFPGQKNQVDLTCREFQSLGDGLFRSFSR